MDQWTGVCINGMMAVEDYIAKVSWSGGFGRAWQNISLCLKVKFLGHIVVVSSLNQLAINFTNNLCFIQMHTWSELDKV